MPPPSVVISLQTFLGLAQNTIHPGGLKCEWGSGRNTCQVTLSCWEALKKHYMHHIHSLQHKNNKRTARDGPFTEWCKLPKCTVTASSYNSPEKLWEHVQSSHLSRVNFDCPIEGCRTIFRNSKAALRHFDEEHRHLEGTSVVLPSPHLKLFWQPFSPPSLPEPRPLPRDPKPGCVLVSVRSAEIRSHRALLSRPSLSQSESSLLASPRGKQPHRQIPVETVLNDDDDLDVPNFAQLPSHPWDADFWTKELTIWRPPAMFEMDVARPQRMIDEPPTEAPISITYEVFAKQVDVLTMEPPPPAMSFPAILRNPGLTGRFAHLQASSTQPVSFPSTTSKKLQREHEARFVGNPHIIAASKQDYIIPFPQPRPTFPEPLPSYLPRTTNVPTISIPERDPSSSNAGRFSLSLKGMRKELRKSGFRAESLVRSVEYELLDWLQEGGIVINPDSPQTDDLTAVGLPIGDTGTIFEVSRTPLQLIWSTENDSFARYVVHCCARYHEVVSYSKELSGRRLTYLLRPNVTRPDHHAINDLHTPPATDIDHSSHFETDSERSGFETDSDVEHPSEQSSSLPVINEDRSLPTSPSRHVDEDQWSIVSDPVLEADESGSDAEVVTGISAVELDSDSFDTEATPKTNLYLRQQAAFRRRELPRERANSSPSRSPMRHRQRSYRIPHHRDPAPRPPRPSQQRSLYEYLFCD
ncbi:hypothetical protein H0H93_007491 [Arthromyces matolae]|nr:hypothetical protein H0H93_007491 [Arthromyces matolae]